MTKNCNILNIPANYHFLKSLLNFIKQRFSKEQITNLKLFLPNQRSCREIKQLFLDNKDCQLLPEIKAISDISYQDFFDFLPNNEAQEIINQILEMKILSKNNYLFFLSQEVQKQNVFGANLEFEQAFKIALNLYNLFDEIERQEIDLKKLNEIDDSNLSQHRLVTLDFLRDFHIQIKNKLLKENIFFATAAQNFLINKFTYLLEKYSYNKHLIIAGSTGSVAFSKKLIKAISQKNHVILYGLDNQNYHEHHHPQFFLSNLCDFLAINKGKITSINQENLLLSSNNRQKLLSLIMALSDDANKWQNIDNFINIKEIKADLENNFKLIAAKNELEEAKIIALALKDANNNNKTSAIISNNNKLTKLLTLELQKLGLAFNNSKNLDIFDSKLIKFLILILELLEDNFNSHNLLAIFKNPLFYSDKNSKIINDFEIEILRQPRTSQGVKGIFDKLQNNSKLQIFFNDFYQKINLFQSNSSLSLAQFSKNLIKIVENLSQNSFQDIFNKEPAQIELFEFFSELSQQNSVIINSNNALATFKTLIGQINYFEKSNSQASIQILSSIEARLLNFDLVVVASLNQGDFPQIESDNWLGKKIKKDLEIDNNLKKIGQSAYDFCNYLSNKSLILTYCTTKNDAPLLESPFLLKFKAICAKIDAKIDNATDYFEQLSSQNNIESQAISQPKPLPSNNLRPKVISITDIAKLLANPYQIYAKRILKLKELNEIDFEPSYAEFGTFVHDALEQFILSKSKNNFIKEAKNLFKKYFSNEESFLIWWPKFENIFNNFIKNNQEFNDCKNSLELEVEGMIGNILIRGKIDRVITNNSNQSQIFDYKTGQMATKKEVYLGVDPQLTIAALLLNNQIISLNYWKLSSFVNDEIKIISNDIVEINALINAAKIGLNKLLNYFEDDKNPYIATQSEVRDFTNLIRQQEWNK